MVYEVHMEKKTNPYSNLMRDYALQLNADFLFNEFLEKVEKNEIREDGTNRLLALIDKCIFYFGE